MDSNHSELYSENLHRLRESFVVDQPVLAKRLFSSVVGNGGGGLVAGNLAAARGAEEQQGSAELENGNPAEKNVSPEKSANMCSRRGSQQEMVFVNAKDGKFAEVSVNDLFTMPSGLLEEKIAVIPVSRYVCIVSGLNLIGINVHVTPHSGQHTSTAQRSTNRPLPLRVQHVEGFGVRLPRPVGGRWLGGQ
jgi:hypothetical protein